MSRDIKEVKTTNSKGSIKQEDKSSRPAWQRQTAHRSVHKKGNCNNEVDCSPSSSLQSRFITLRFQSSWVLKDALRGRRFAEDVELKHNVCGEFRRFSKEFYATAIHRLMKFGKNALLMQEILWKNNLNSVKEVPRIYANVIIIVNYSFWEKNKRHYFLIAPRISEYIFTIMRLSRGILFGNRFQLNAANRNKKFSETIQHDLSLPFLSSS
jgi:hypothetical protein